MSTKSCIYRGRVRHRRFRPVENAFSYWVYMMYIDLDELPDLFRGRWLWSAERPAPAWFRRRDYLGDPNVETIVAEITNTPWSERHSYVLSEAMNRSDSKRKKRFQFAKDFHVSPFLPMDMGYDWRFVDPSRELVVHMENIEKGATVFDATMHLSRREISGPALAKTLAFHPLMTWKVIAAIHWQALRLWWKRAPFYIHPSKRHIPEEVSQP